MNRPVPVSAEGVEILSTTTTTTARRAAKPMELVRGLDEDERLLAALERRVGFSDDAWESWRGITLEYCAQHSLDARDIGDVALVTRAEDNLRRVLRLGERRGP